MLCEIALGLVAIFLGIYLVGQHKFKHWKELGIPHRPPTFPLGNCEGLSRTRNVADILQNIYVEGKGKLIYGVYILFGPNVLIRDPELVKSVLIKDFACFSGRGFNIDLESDPLSGHLFFLEGASWRNLRTKLTPTFTSGKMRMMFPIIEECCKELGQYLSAQNGKVHEVVEVFMKFTTNVITRCAFGLDVDFLNNPDPMLWEIIHRVSNPTKIDALKRGLTFSVGQVLPFLKFPLTPRDLTTFFINLVKNAMDEREKKKIVRKDFLQLLIELKNKGFVSDPDAPKDDNEANDHKFSTNEAAAQAFVFLLGGFDTSSTTLQSCLYELALHPEIQEKARKEVQEVLEKNGLTYESIHEMHYLEQILKETLRLHPVVRFLGRQCSRPYQIPKTDLFIEPGMKVWISTSGLQMDPKFFPQPEKFDPERFSEENKGNIVPYTYLPFGDGPRICIGNRFAMMNMKAVLAYILSEFKIEMSEDTPLPPLKLDPKKAIALVLGGVPLKISNLGKKTV